MQTLSVRKSNDEPTQDKEEVHEQEAVPDKRAEVKVMERLQMHERDQRGADAAKAVENVESLHKNLSGKPTLVSIKFHSEVELPPLSLIKSHLSSARLIQSTQDETSTSLG